MTEPRWVVKDVKANDDYTLMLSFADGKKGIYDVKPWLKYKIFEPLKNKGLFSLAKIECGSVVWNDDIDIDPEILYQDSRPVEEASNA